MTDVRAITVKQPWAWAIAQGGKTVENRTQGSSWRGPLLIHAGLDWSEVGATDARVLQAWRRRHGLETGIHHLVPRGQVVAVARLADVHPDEDCCRPWGEGSLSFTQDFRRVHHLVLADVVALDRPVPAKGALGLWRPPDDVLAQVTAQVALPPG